MNIFILSTGRCGSSTFIKACQHIYNYSAAHESHIAKYAQQRLAYPNNHIEADNRLAWFLGRLDIAYADKPVFYVHLQRDREDTARSFTKRWDYGIMRAYRKDILLGLENTQDIQQRLAISRDYYDTVNSNITFFLKHKPNSMVFSLEHAQRDFGQFWEQIKATGKKEKALQEWDICYNASEGK